MPIRIAKTNISSESPSDSPSGNHSSRSPESRPESKHSKALKKHPLENQLKGPEVKNPEVTQGEIPTPESIIKKFNLKIKARRDYSSVSDWIAQRIKPQEIEKYIDKEAEKNPHRDFINDELIWHKINEAREKVLKAPLQEVKKRLQEILSKSYETVEALPLEDVAFLISVMKDLNDPELNEEIFKTALKIKLKVYDNRIVTFAPLYMGNFCVNNCLYCGFRKENNVIKRRVLTMEEIAREAENLAGRIGHKRLIVVYGEHPATDVHYIAESLKTIYETKVKTRTGSTVSIRRANVNAAPMQIDELKLLKEIGIGTFQVFQETYHHETYRHLHPQNTVKGNYAWRLYCMHRALEAGVDDVGIGALFGLYDWRFEVMGLVAHSHELEKKFGIGPHTISFPRLEPAANTPFVQQARYKVSDEDFFKIIAILRISVPYTGMIITAREPKWIRDRSFNIGVTQTDADTRIGIGAYSERYDKQEAERQQFLLGDTRSLDELIRDLAKMGYITSFCTAGYRCGRTGAMIMGLLKSGKEGQFCKLNAILTFKEWLEDFASEETKKIGEQLIQKEIEEVKQKIPAAYPMLMEFYNRIANGERDLYF